MILGHQEISILLCPYAVCFSVIKSCTYWDSSTLQALHEHACLFLIYKCNVDRVGKMPSSRSNKTVSRDLKSFLSLIVNYVSISLHRRGGRGRGMSPNQEPITPRSHSGIGHVAPYLPLDDHSHNPSLNLN